MLSVRFSSFLFLVCLAAGCNNGGPMDPGGPWRHRCPLRTQCRLQHVRTDEANCGDCGNACDAGAVCEGGVCNAPDAPIGNPCTSDAVCAPGTCIRAASGFPSGYCTASCDFDSCPAGATCVALDYGGGDIRMNCLLSCTAARDCRAGYTCQSSFDGDDCFPG